MRFPLLRLPFVVISTILKFLKPNEFLYLSLSSKRVHSLTKLIGYDFEENGIDITAHGKLSIAIGTLDMEWKLFEISEISETAENVLKIGNSTVPYKTHSDCLQTFWPDFQIGLITVLEYLRPFFNSKISDIYISDLEKSAMILDSICGYTVERCLFDNMETTIDDITLLKLLESREINDLSLHVSPENGFKFNETLHFENFCTHHGFWVTVENLMGLNAKYVEIINTKLSGNEINRLIREWMGADVQFLALENEFIEVDEVLRGFEVVEWREPRVYTYIENMELDMNDGFDITRNDGSVATVHFNNLANGHIGIYFLVWPDFDNKSY